MHKVVYRKTSEADFEGVSKLLAQAKLREPYFTRDRFENMLARNRGFCYVAEDEVEIIGNVFGTHDGGFIGYLRKIAVKEVYRRQKIASNLVRIAVEKFEEAGIPLIFAHVEKTNEPSLGLLKSLGFEIRDSHYLIDRGYEKK